MKRFVMLGSLVLRSMHNSVDGMIDYLAERGEFFLRKFSDGKWHASIEIPAPKGCTTKVSSDYNHATHYEALRAWSVASFAMVPVIIGLGVVVYTSEALKKIAVESVGYVAETFGANYRNLREDIRGCKNIWKGEYGKGKLIVRNPAGKPTTIED